MNRRKSVRSGIPNSDPYV